MKRTADIAKAIGTARLATSAASFAGAARYAARRMGAMDLVDLSDRDGTMRRLDAQVALMRWEALEARRALLG